MADNPIPPARRDRPRTGLPESAGAFTLACYWLVFLRQMSAQWSVYDSYHYGWVVPLLCGGMVWRRNRLAPTLPGPPGPAWKADPRPARLNRLPVAAWLMAAVALAYAPTRFLHEASPIWRLTSLLLALEVVGLTLVAIYLGGGIGEVRRFAFPLAFVLVAVPWPSGLENFLVQTFTQCDISASVGILGLFGVPALQHGNAIEVARGWVGIDEACSGIRSLQATTMISLVLGEYYRLGARRRLWCLLAGFGCSFGFNLIRTSLLVWLEAGSGPAVMARWHDPAGTALLTGGFLFLWFVARTLARNKSADATRSVAPLVRPPSRPRSVAALFSLPLPAAAALLVWLVLVETGTEAWYRWHETNAAGVHQWGLRADADLPGHGNTTIPPEELDQFEADNAVERRWTDASGNHWQLYYFRWLPSQSLERRVATQMAKTHGPEKCLPAMGLTLADNAGRVVISAGDFSLTFQQYFFTDENRPVHVFYGLYEDPSGSLVLANRRTDSISRIAAALAGSRNSGQRLLEIAVTGPAEPREARVALSRVLPTLIKVEE